MSNYDKFHAMLNNEIKRRLEMIKACQEEINDLKAKIAKKEIDINTQRYFVSELIEADQNHQRRGKDEKEKLRGL